MKLIVRAPAKINWTLEVLGRRNDGYHEVRTVLQTIDLVDTLTFERADDVTIEQDSATPIPDEENLAWQAAQLLRERVARNSGARLHLRKDIPIAAGLGGGSSDAAATLRGLNELWGLGLSANKLAEIGAEVGSDVPFFLYGGTALAEGRGEIITPLPDLNNVWLVLVAPTIELPAKTATLFGQLRPDDFSHGRHTADFVKSLKGGLALKDKALVNVFERASLEVFPSLEGHWKALADASGRPVHLAGAGPTLFVLAQDEADAKAIVYSVNQRIDADVYAAATIGTEAATALPS